MFNDFPQPHVYYSNNTSMSRVTKNTTIHEHRAPTDDSVKLLREMEDKAREALLSQFELKTNLFTARVFVIQNPMAIWDDYYSLHIHYNLNGDDFKIVVKSAVDDDFPKIVETATKALSESLAKYALQSAFENIDETSRRVIAQIVDRRR